MRGRNSFLLNGKVDEKNPDNKTLHRPAIPMRSIAASELGRSLLGDITCATPFFRLYCNRNEI
ncbi:MAG: hypothetical protein GKR87_13515 [Kiritimatiellae bacterium]|nr:hypothetical protein [Kiritimatiellia bacterium]